MKIIGYNDDLIAHILLHLPVKSLLRFKSVSKQWNNLLSSPIFIQRHASHQRIMSNSVFFFHIHGITSLYLKRDNLRLDPVDFGFLHNSCQDCSLEIKSCNGLLLLQSTHVLVKNQHRRQRQRFYYHVYNPFTRKHLELALPDYIATHRDMLFHLAFDPSKSPHYKVVFCWYGDGTSDTTYHIAIYSSETRTCKKLGYTFESHFDQLRSGVFLNGAIHWISYLHHSSLYNMKSTSFYFDINQELIKVYPMPQFSLSNVGIDCLHFGKCQGHLILVLSELIVQELHQHVLDVYELREDYSSWFLKYKIDLDVIAVEFPEIIITGNHSGKCYGYSFLYVLESDSDEPTLVLSVGNQLLAYNLIDKTTMKLCNFSDIRYYRGYFTSHWWDVAVHCIENLFSV